MVATSAPSTFASFAASNAASPFGTLSASGGSGAGFGGFGGANGSALGNGIGAFGAPGVPRWRAGVLLVALLWTGVEDTEAAQVVIAARLLACCSAGTGLRQFLLCKSTASVAVFRTTAPQAEAAGLLHAWWQEISASLLLCS